MTNPGLWSGFANEALYPLVINLFQVAQAHNVPLSDDKSIVYHVPSETVEFDPYLMWPGLYPPGTLRSFVFDAVVGADNTNDTWVTMRDVFDVLVDTTRNISPTCKRFVSRSQSNGPLRFWLLLGYSRGSLEYRVSTTLRGLTLAGRRGVDD